MDISSNRCAHTEALNRYEKDMEKNEKQAEYEIKEFRDSMDDYVDLIVTAFNKEAKHSNINRNELRAILLEDLENSL